MDTGMQALRLVIYDETLLLRRGMRGSERRRVADILPDGLGAERAGKLLETSGRFDLFQRSAGTVQPVGNAQAFGFGGVARFLQKALEVVYMPAPKLPVNGLLRHKPRRIPVT